MWAVVQAGVTLHDEIKLHSPYARERTASRDVGKGVGDPASGGANTHEKNIASMWRK